MSAFAAVAGLAMRFTHRYKAIQLFGICLYLLAMGLFFAATRQVDPNDALLVMAAVRSFSLRSR